LHFHPKEIHEHQREAGRAVTTLAGQAQATIQAAGRCIPGLADLEFDTENPVAMSITTAFGPLWEKERIELARVLVDGALSKPRRNFGHGDVRVEMVSAVAVRFLVRTDRSRDGWRAFLVERDALEDFMIRTFVVAPACREFEDVDTAVDTAIEQILGGQS
jgi:hypothetical protein